MRIAIAMRSLRNDMVETVDSDQGECFANFEVQDGNVGGQAEDQDEDETVQVTVVLRGRRGELENPALSVTELVLGTLKAQAGEGQPRNNQRNVIDAMGVALTG